MKKRQLTYLTKLLIHTHPAKGYLIILIVPLLEHKKAKLKKKKEKVNKLFIILKHITKSNYFMQVNIIIIII